MTEIPGDLGHAQGDNDNRTGRTDWVGARCAWCGISAGAVPDEPPIRYEGAWYHRRGCASSARLVATGKLPAGYGAWSA